MGWIEGETRPIACQVIPHLDRSFVQPWIEEQQQLPWFSVDAKIRFQLLLMDSFAELTDQKFMHRRDGWAFCCHYSDLKHTPAFENEFESCGLLPTEEFRKVYETFFKWYFTKNPKGQVVFLHFPTKLDPRTQFKERAAVLRQVIEELVPQFPRIHSLCVPDDIVKADQANPHRYHFSPETTDTFGSQWASLPSPARVRAFFK